MMDEARDTDTPSADAAIAAFQQRPRDASREEIDRLWEAMWRAIDFSWNGLANAGWELGDGASEAQKLKRWRAPLSFPGGGRVHGAGEGAWKEASLQDYWRWSLGAPGFEAAEPDAHRLLDDQDLTAAGLLLERDGRWFHAIHCAGLRALVGLDADEAEADLRSAVAASPAQTSPAAEGAPSGQALGEAILARLAAAGGWSGEADAPDRRAQMTGCRAVWLTEVGRAHAGPDPNTPRPIHLTAGFADFGGVNANNLTFGDRAYFGSATFGDRASFRSATFGDRAYFGSATFGDRASFRSATFGAEAKFHSATFGAEAKFHSATFGAEASFRSATFGDRASFRSATFGGGASFVSATFGAEASFRSATFGDRASFRSATFGDRASFRSATFGDRAYFGSATFGAEASFGSATFGDRASFRSATFGGGASFVSATFGAEASFRSATFGDRASFRSATFGDRASFRSATFGDRAYFGSATFGAEASFGSATFGDRASFRSATFGAEASFVSATFGDRAYFGSATFGDRAWFVGARFLGRTFFQTRRGDGQARFRGVFSFQDAIFSDTVSFSDTDLPSGKAAHRAFSATRFKEPARFEDFELTAFAAFDGATFEKGVILDDPGRDADRLFRRAEKAAFDAARADAPDSGPRWYWPFRGKARVQALDSHLGALEGGLRTLKLAMDKASDRIREQRYYRYELMTRRKRPSTPVWERLVSRLFALLSDYGGSMLRPFLSVIAMGVLFGAIYYAWATGLGEAVTACRSDLDNANGAAMFSLGQSFRPFGVWWGASVPVAPQGAVMTPWETCFGQAAAPARFFGVSHWVIIKILATIQSFFSLVLLFLFALAVRRRFQIT